MSVIPAQTNREVLPTDRSGHVFAPRGLGDTSGPLGDIASAVNQLGQAGATMERLQAIAAQKAELAEHQAMADKLYNDHKLFMSSRQDEDIIGEDGAFKTTLYRDTWNKTYEEIKKLSGSFVYRDSKAAFDNWVTKSQPTWQVGTDVAVIESKNQKLIMQADAFLDQLAFLSPATVRTILGVESAQYFTDDPRIDEIMKAEQGPKDLTDDLENRKKLAEKTIEELVATGAVSPQWAIWRLGQAEKTYQAAHDKAAAETLTVLATSHRDPITQQIDISEGIDAINAAEGFTEKQKGDAIKEFTSRAANEKKGFEEDLAVRQEEDRRKLYSAIMNNQYTPSLATGTSLSVDEQHKFDTWNEQRIDRLNKGIEVVTDKQVFSRLKDLAVAIEDDRASRQVAQDALNEASAEGLINDDDWEIVDNMIRTSYSTSRKAADANARAVGIKQIVGIDLPATGDIGAQIQREIARLRGAAQTPAEKLRWRLYDSYMNDMREWFEDPKNKDKVKESYQVTTSKAQLYKALSDQPDELIHEALGQTGPDRTISDILGGERIGGFDKGDIVTRGTKKYRVVDFDTDGEPLVEEVK
jgi:hypothetical protein